MMDVATREIAETLDAGWTAPAAFAVTASGEALASAFDVTGLATACVGAAGAEVAALTGDTGPAAAVVNDRLASLWFRWSLQPRGWTVPPAWDAIAGDYRTADGWIRLHTNAPRHRAAALRVLGTQADRDKVRAAVAGWPADGLEEAVISEGGCAGAMRSIEAWADHPQGRAVAAEPLIAWEKHAGGGGLPHRPLRRDRPLAGIRVLDLTRVLAGPVSTRFLAAFGASVLRIDPPAWDEPGIVPEVTPGKRCAMLDLSRTAHRETFERLLAGADVLVHGYRPGALDRLGYTPAGLDALAPHLIRVTLDAYGWTGPWAARRGFDSIVQMSAGIADRGMRTAGATHPVPMPVQALDHATGYLMAAAAVRALRARQDAGVRLAARVSLARTAALLASLPARPGRPEIADIDETDLAPAIETTAWGPARRLRFPVVCGDAEGRFDIPAGPLRSGRPAWP